MRMRALGLLLGLAFASLTSAQIFENIAPDLGLDITTPCGDVFAVDLNGDEQNDLLYTSRFDGPNYYFQYNNGTYDQLSINLPSVDNDAGKIIPADFDHDNDLDLFLCEYHYSCVFLVNEDGQMVDRTAEMGLPTRTGGRDVAFVDLDHDSWLDIIIGYYDIGWKVFHNNSGDSFTDITNAVGLPWIDDFHRFCESDVDLDGDVDLFMTTVHGEDFFFLNNDGVFEDYSQQSGLVQAVGQGGCFWADFDNDKLPDLFTGGAGEHVIWHNDGDASFTLMTMHGTPATFDQYPYSAIYVSGDYDHDGDLDVFAGEPGGGGSYDKADQFFRCDSIVGLNAYFTDIAPELGMDIMADTRPQFFDYDRDGDLDLFIRVYGEPSRLYRNNLNGAPLTRVRAEGPEGELDCWLTRIEVYEHGTENLVVCGETNYGGARRDGMNHTFTLNPDSEYDLRVYYGDGTAMTPETYPDLSGVTPAEFGNLIVVRRGVGVMVGTPVNPPAPVPTEFSVSTYPNPFNAVANIELDLAVASEVSVNVFDVQGRLAATLLNGSVNSGKTRLQWNAENFSSGIYFVRVTAGELTKNAKLVLMK